MTTPQPTTPRQGTSGFGDVLVSARSLAEYRAMFDLSDTDLSGSVLDCPGGAASFTAEACELGADVVAVDPTYPAAGPAALRAEGLRQLGKRASVEAERGHDWTRTHPEGFVWTFFATPEDHLAQRRRAAAAFTTHAAAEPEHYVQASLPRLPFDDGAFDLVLSSHLLFTYADRLDDAFHLAALRELVRVARGEVRVYPLVVVGGDREHEGLAELLSLLAADGVVAELRPTAYRFQRGADRMLVLR
ncbi:Methyltransferase domain-containing protein [Quadrisphaera granulorum]|uniref:Methyltransferase family protein n=1 Tax=Quadrisphaera granulorum TaxID=317664 RepID=A0A316A989_9ACTN|nr:methyltransferase domain-containing protein [Quadrisphaera granulorum]PWJ54193.1 methyltransferase family protein [Quadrisphaera granulorum]SZE96332.1 Methyltransferase domain-containing protein [Quadrisphaera granulorum]